MTYETIIGKEKTIEEYEEDRECPDGCQYCTTLKDCYGGYIQERKRLITLMDKAKKEVFDELKEAFPKTLQPLGTKKEILIPKWKAIKAIGLLIDDIEKRHLSTSQSEGTELSFKVPSHSSDKPCPTCKDMDKHVKDTAECGSCGRIIKSKARL